MRICLSSLAHAGALSLLLPVLSFASVTGKIAGKVVDKSTGQALPGANVMIEGTSYGASTDVNGEFFILNIPPSRVSVTASMIGYGRVRMEDVIVSTNATSTLLFRLQQTVLEGEVVVVRADPMTTRKDQTSSVRHVTSETIQTLPVENLQAVINLQAGVVNGHFRGGRQNEVAYMIDGLPVGDAFSRDERQAEVENEVVEDIEIISGTFNAEYGKAMSGVVNVVTKDGGNTWSGGASGQFGNYLTAHDDVFIGLKPAQFDRKVNWRFNVSGPLLKDRLFLLGNLRVRDENNHLNGIYRFNPYDYSDYRSNRPEDWYSEHTGDNAYVPMDKYKGYTLYGKLVFKPANALKIALSVNNGESTSGFYSHYYMYNPKALPQSHDRSTNAILSFNHMFSKKGFQELKVMAVDRWDGTYVYRNPNDSRYVNDWYSLNPGPGFSTGGNDKTHSQSYTKKLDVKYDLNLQVSGHHNLKTGLLATSNDKNILNRTIVNELRNSTLDRLQDTVFTATGMKIRYPHYVPVILDDSTAYADLYRKKPVEFSAYIEDKMEYEDLVINLGVRYDWFDPRTDVPSNWRNPANQLRYDGNPERMSTYSAAKPSSQLSPRFGLAYTLGSAAKLHFSYGHFFQVPDAYAMYQTHNFLIVNSDFASTLGNPELKPEKSVKYEIGLWQELVKGVGLDVVLYYADVYNLLSTRVLTTYNDVKYGQFTNKDYGNRRGLEIGLTADSGPFHGALNYTLQYTLGNADDPLQTFNRAGSNIDPIKRLIPLAWDQRHTLNVSAGIQSRRAGASLIYYYNSGTPFTWTPLDNSLLAFVNLYPNNSTIPASGRVDLNGHYDIPLRRRLSLRFSLLVYNLLDAKNELYVDATTGRANQSIVRDVDLINHHSDFTDYYATIYNPAAFSAPREVKFSIGIQF